MMDILDLADEQINTKYFGPCKRCGRSWYELSTSGPDFCGACACGDKLEDIYVRDRIEQLTARAFDQSCAIQILLGTRFYMTDKMRERGQAVIDKVLSDAAAKARYDHQEQTCPQPPQQE